MREIKNDLIKQHTALRFDSARHLEFAGPPRQTVSEVVGVQGLRQSERSAGRRVLGHGRRGELRGDESGVAPVFGVHIGDDGLGHVGRIPVPRDRAEPDRPRRGVGVV